MGIDVTQELPEMYFDGELGNSALDDELRAWLNARLTGEGRAVQQTTAERVDVWVDGDSGSDLNNGASDVRALKTIEAAAAILNGTLGPATEWLVIHLRGTITLASAKAFKWICLRAAVNSPTKIIIDGGTDVTVVLDDGGGGEIVSDINAAGQIGLTTGGYTYNAYRGYWLKITSGPMSGQRHLVWKNDATTFYLLETGPAALGDPGAGATFHVERPATEVTAAPFSFTSLGAYVSGQHALYIQNLYVTGGAMTEYQSSMTWDSFVAYSHVVHSALPVQLFPAVFAKQNADIRFIGDLWDVSAATPTSSAAERIGVSQVANSISGMIFSGLASHEINYSVIPELWSIYGGQVNVYASSIEFWNLIDQKGSAHSNAAAGGHTAFRGDSPGVPTRFGSYRATGVPGTPVWPAIALYNSSLGLNKSICDDAVHGIEAFGGAVALLREVSGSNSATGVYCHASSTIFVFRHFGSGVPTVSGNSGTVELSDDGSTQVSAWAGISGTPVSTPECVAQDHTTYVGPPWDG